MISCHDGAVETIDEGALRFAVSTTTSGRVMMRYFRHPRDTEGVDLNLTTRERDQLAQALGTPGFHAIARESEPDRQLRLFP